MNKLSIIPGAIQKISSEILDFELIRSLSESEAYAWWLDYRERFQDAVEDSYLTDDVFQGSVNQQAS